jgi:hypothetical protein
MLQSSSHVAFDAGTACALHLRNSKKSKQWPPSTCRHRFVLFIIPYGGTGIARLLPQRAHVVLIKAPRVFKHTRALHVELSDAAPESQQANHVRMPPSLFIKTSRELRFVLALSVFAPFSVTNLDLNPLSVRLFVQLVETRRPSPRVMCLRHSIFGRERKTAQASQSTVLSTDLRSRTFSPVNNTVPHGPIYPVSLAYPIR